MSPVNNDCYAQLIVPLSSGASRLWQARLMIRLDGRQFASRNKPPVVKQHVSSELMYSPQILFSPTKKRRHRLGFVET